MTYSSGRGSRLSSAASGNDAAVKSQPTSAASASKTASNLYQTPIGISVTQLFFQKANYHKQGFTSTDTSYQDQLGPLQERPKTSRRLMNAESDELDVGDDLLPL